MLSIRKYKKEDCEAVKYVCLHSTHEEYDEKLSEFILHTFCEYYLDREPDNCFVLDADGKAAGYVYCAQDYDTYKEIFDEEYLDRNSHLGDELYQWALDSTILQNKHKADFPAHLHIDILPEYHRQGWGGKLITALTDHLRQKGVKGVMLTTGTDNPNANSFYKKYGFELIEIYDTDVAYGIRLD